MAGYKLTNWSDIQGKFSDCLLVGNGASIAVDPRFSYRSLLEQAKTSRSISQEVDQLFQYFKTQDFEYILSMLWHTYHVNQALGVEEQKTIQVYGNTREALIRVVRDIHISYDETQAHLPKIAQFLKHFKTIISLNYDLIVYWAFLWANDTDPSVMFKDCFLSGEYVYDWAWLRKPIAPAVRSILVFYPHGNLVLATNLLGLTTKIARQNDTRYLIDQILDRWELRQVSPLFVSEGESTQKKKAIMRNGYLSSVYNTVLPKAKESIVVYGWSMSASDDHILEALLGSGVQRIAVSVYKGNPDWQDYCQCVDRKIHSSSWGQRRIKVEFYDSDSKGCWNN